MSEDIVKLSNAQGSGIIFFTIDIDDTKVAHYNKIYHKYRIIIGGCHPTSFHYPK